MAQVQGGMGEGVWGAWPIYIYVYGPCPPHTPSPIPPRTCAISPIPLQNPKNRPRRTPLVFITIAIIAIIAIAAIITVAVPPAGPAAAQEPCRPPDPPPPRSRLGRRRGAGGGGLEAAGRVAGGRAAGRAAGRGRASIK